MQDFEKHKKNFFSYLDKIGNDESVGIVAHANCVDGMASTVFLIEILKKKYHSIKTDVHFVSYGNGVLDKISERFKKIDITKVFVLDFNADIDMLEEFERFRGNFDVCFVDHHPLNPKLRIDEKVIKTNKEDCTSLVIYKFGKGIIDYVKWNWLVCAASVSEFSWKNDENLKFIQDYYPSYKPGDENSELLKIVNKMGSLVSYYAKDSLKAYELILNKDFEKIDKIHQEVWNEMDRCLNDFEKNSESHFDKHLYFYFFKSKFPIGSKMGTILSLRHKGSTIVILSDMEGTNMIKASGRNNGEPLKYSINEMMKAGIVGLDNALAGGHAPASGGSFMKKDIDTFKRNIIEFVKNKLSKSKSLS